MLSKIFSWVIDFKVCTIKDIPVVITRGWFFFVAFLWAWVLLWNGLALANLVLAYFGMTYFFVVLHEFGHAAAARKMGYQTESIKLVPFSGIALIPGQWIKKPKDEFIIAIGGPLVNLVIAALTLPAALIWFGPEFWLSGNPAFSGDAFDVTFYILREIGRTNLILVLFNMLPIVPMDGGRVLRSLLGMYWKDTYRATDVAVKVGVAVAIPVILAILIFDRTWLQAAFILPLIVMAGFEERKKMFMKFAEWSNTSNHLKRKLDRHEAIDENDEDAIICDRVVDKILKNIDESINGLASRTKEDRKYLIHAKSVALLQRDAYKVLDLANNFKQAKLEKDYIMFEMQIKLLSKKVFQEASAA